jgi:hypothetical protein
MNSDFYVISDSFYMMDLFIYVIMTLYYVIIAIQALASFIYPLNLIKKLTTS